jgi:NDP-sugar pyrophosphorylase family protein
MRAVILAGGEGTRLRPLTFTLPKPLIPLLNRPLLEYSLRLLKRHAIRDVILAVSHQSEAIRAHFGDGRHLDMHIQYHLEAMPLGTGGALRGAAGSIQETFLAMNGDLIMDADLTALVAFHRERRAVATIGVRPVDDPSDFGLVLTGDDLRVRSFQEKTPEDPTGRNLINSGLYVMEPAALAQTPDGTRWSVERQTFPDLIASGQPVFACPIEGYWIDLSTPERLLQATRDLLEGRSSAHPPDPTCEEDPRVAHAPACIAEACDISPDAVVGPYAVLGDGVRVGAHAVVEGSVLLEGTQVGEGARLRGALIGRECRIRDGIRLGAGTVLGDRSVVA